MILGIGCDIVHIPRIRALLHRSRDASAGPSRVFCDKRAINFARRIFGTDELEAFRKRFILADGEVDERTVTLFLAGRFAVKESSYKALRPHYALDWSDVNIVSENGKPSIILAERVLSKLGAVNSQVSISHDGEYAMATVIFERINS